MHHRQEIMIRHHISLFHIFEENIFLDFFSQ